MLFVARTRHEAIEVAGRQLMASPLGGLLRVYSAHGGLEHAIPYTAAGPTLQLPWRDLLDHMLPPSDVSTTNGGLRPSPEPPHESSTINQVSASNPPTPQRSSDTQGDVRGSHPTPAAAALGPDGTSAETSGHSSDGRPAGGWPMGWIWTGVFILVAMLAYGATAQEALLSLLDDPQEDRIAALVVAAVYTLPATVSFYLVALAFLRNWLSRVPAIEAIVLITGLFFVMALIARSLPIGLAVEFPATDPTPGSHPVAKFLFFVLTAYLTSWGLPLFAAAGLLGAAAAMQTDNYLSKHMGT